MLDVKVFDNAFYDVFDVEQDLICLSDEFKFTEGPIWDKAEKKYIFNDIAASTSYTYDPSKNEFKPLRDGTTYKANGNTFDLNGDVLTCEHETSRVSRTKTDGSVYEVLVSHYGDLELNSPNDIIVGTDGKIWFTDPNFGRRDTWIAKFRQQQLPSQGVFCYDEKTKKLDLAFDDFGNPNGLCFNLDETKMLVADSPEHKVFIFDVEDTKLTNKTLFADTVYEGTGVPDGLKIDKVGNVICAAQGGLHIFKEDGTPLGIINMPKQSANFCFGSEDMKTIFVTATSSIYTIKIKTGLNA